MFHRQVSVVPESVLAAVGESDSTVANDGSGKGDRVGAIRARAEDGGVAVGGGIDPVLVVRAGREISPVTGGCGPSAAAVLSASRCPRWRPKANPPRGRGVASMSRAATAARLKDRIFFIRFDFHKVDRSVHSHGPPQAFSSSRAVPKRIDREKLCTYRFRHHANADGFDPGSMLNES